MCIRDSPRYKHTCLHTRTQVAIGGVEDVGAAPYVCMRFMCVSGVRMDDVHKSSLFHFPCFFLQWSTFRQSSIAMLRSILNCNTCWTKVLQQRIDKSIATLLWPLLTSLHIYPHYCFTVHVVHCICNLQTITASTLQRVWRLGTQESGLMRCACVKLLDDCWK